MEDKNGDTPQQEEGSAPQQEDGAAAQTEQVREARKHFSRLGARFLAGTIVIFAVQILALSLAEALAPGSTDDMNVSLLVTMLPMYLIGIPVLAFLVGKLPSRTPEHRTMKPGQFAVAAVMAFSLMYAANYIGTILTTIIGIFKNSEVENTVANVVSETNVLTTFFIMVLCAPAIEEFVFRKLLVDRALRYGQGTAVVLSGLMFGLFHGNLNQFMYATALGMFLAFLYAKTGKLKVTIAIHMLVNFVGSVVSSWMLKLVDLDALLELDMNNMGMVMENLAGFLAYLAYAFCIFGLMVAGIVLFIVFAAKRKFVFEKGAVCIPRGKRFRTVICNLGMSLYCVFWIGMMIYQLLA